MPLVIHPRIGKALRRVALATAVASIGVTGVAQANCVQPPTTQAFAQFGDNADYSLAPGGTFDPSGSPSWDLGLNTLLGESDSLLGAADASSATILPATSIVSPPFCVDASNPYLRLVAKKVLGAKGALTVDILYTDASGAARSATAGSITQGGKTDYSSWAPSPILSLANSLPIGRSATGDYTVRLRITSSNTPGLWAVDDVYVDPYRMG